jgi:hypothetical protein
MNVLRMGQTYRYSQPYNHGKEIIDNLPNHFYHTYTYGEKYALLDSGINPVMSITIEKAVNAGLQSSSQAAPIR